MTHTSQKPVVNAYSQKRIAALATALFKLNTKQPTHFALARAA